MNRFSTLAPTSSLERITALDVLRGFAVLGILLMNIQSFSMIMAAYMNPTAYGNLQGANLWVWVTCHIFADQKFMSIFSLLFGAGILLLTQRAEARGRGAAAIHYSRTWWLLVIGMAHAYLVWHSDILVTYALCGVVAYWFRKVSARWLSLLALLALTVPSLIYMAAAYSLPLWPPEAMVDVRTEWQPTPEQVTREIETYRGGWLTQMSDRAPSALLFQTVVVALWTGWRAGGLMLLGMALFKWGILTAQRSTRFYTTLLVSCSAIGFPFIALGVVRNFAADWSMNYSMFIGFQFNYWGSLLIALAYVAALMLVVRSGILARVQRALAAVGRTALTNYLAQSVICTFIFYGHGLGLFGRVERYQQLLIVLGVWAIEITTSILWLRHFRYGPMEWVWRSLTYLRLQPMRLGTTPLPPVDSKPPILCQ